MRCLGRPRGASDTSRRGMFTVESALLALVVVTALTVFYSFIRDAVSHRLKLGADAFGYGMRYAP